MVDCFRSVIFFLMDMNNPHVELQVNLDLFAAKNIERNTTPVDNHSLNNSAID